MESSEIDYHQKLIDSLLYFTQIFYFLRTNRKFDLTYPDGRESHIITICKALTRVINGETKRLIINVPPRYGKTELVIHFVAWTLAQFKDSNYLYVSYSHSLAKKQTQTIRSIITLPEYREIFGVKLKDDQSAKDNFETIHGGSVYAAGAGGSITGRGAGISGANRFGGCIIIDDIHKPDEVTSDTMRESINDWYFNTLQSRVNSFNTPIIFIGQRLHEDDLASRLINTKEWETVIIPAIDEADNALHPAMHDLKTLKKMQAEMSYVFASQYQQNPIPSGGGLFKRDMFIELEEMPKILSTFITCDTAETDKQYNDATVFSFWGLYKIRMRNEETDTYGLHWIDCWEQRIEPKDLQDSFMDFWSSCMRFKVQPQFAALEKKSTGVTLLSVLKTIPGMRVIDIERSGTVNSKTNRFIAMQPYISKKQVTLPQDARHTKLCIDHMTKITANNSHRWDDIADTCYDAVKIALIDKSLTVLEKDKTEDKVIAKNFYSHQNRIDKLRRGAFTK